MVVALTPQARYEGIQLHVVHNAGARDEPDVTMMVNHTAVTENTAATQHGGTIVSDLIQIAAAPQHKQTRNNRTLSVDRIRCTQPLCR